MSTKARQIPHTYVIIFCIIVVVAIMTWFVPGGQFDRETKILDNGITSEVIVQNSFHYTQNKPQTWEVFSALFEGFVDKADIIVFILLIGGAFWILSSTKAIDLGIYWFLDRAKKLEKYRFIKFLGVYPIMLTLITLMFSFFGAIYGMSEETIAFVVIFVPLSISMGYDSIVGLCICYVAASLGFAGAMLNPFTIGIAQGLSNLPLFSGLEYRFVCWLIITFVGTVFILRYAKKIKQSPEKSVMYTLDGYWREKHHEEEREDITYFTPKSAWIVWGLILVALMIYDTIYPLSTLTVASHTVSLPLLPILTLGFCIFGYLSLKKSVHFFILQLLGLTIGLLIVGVMSYDWYIMEIATLFFAMGILTGLAYNFTPNKICQLFTEGTKDILSTALVVGLAGGIIFILNHGQIIDTLLYLAAKSMGNWGRLASLQMMYVLQTIINVLIPSGSAKAALTMPIMSQFSDIIGVSRQATVMAFQFGDGFTNMITPTSGVLIGALGVAHIPYDKWLRWVTPFIVLLILLGALLLLPTLYFPLDGF